MRWNAGLSGVMEEWGVVWGTGVMDGQPESIMDHCGAMTRIVQLNGVWGGSPVLERSGSVVV